MKPVLTKTDFVSRYSAGEFGNASPTWASVKEFLAADYSGGDVHLRNRIAGGQTFYNIPPREVPALAVRLSDCIDLYYVSAMAPSDRTLIQGEVIQSVNYIDLTYNCQPMPMRNGFAIEQKTANGLTAKLLLQQHMNPASFDWLNHLLSEYPGHVVEFSVYDIEWGTLAGYNTVFWEVRLY